MLGSYSHSFAQSKTLQVKAVSMETDRYNERGQVQSKIRQGNAQIPIAIDFERSWVQISTDTPVNIILLDTLPEHKPRPLQPYLSSEETNELAKNVSCRFKNWTWPRHLAHLPSDIRRRQVGGTPKSSFSCSTDLPTVSLPLLFTDLYIVQSYVPTTFPKPPSTFRTGKAIRGTWQNYLHADPEVLLLQH